MKTLTKTTRLFYGIFTLLLILGISPATFGQKIFGTVGEAGPRGGGSIVSMDPDGENFKIEHAFELPISGPIRLVEGRDGFYYGIHYEGIYGNGAISRYSADGMQMEVLHYFEGGVNGRVMAIDLIQDDEGYFYGTALGGQFDDGLIFRLSETGEYTVLYHFDSSQPEGGSPEGGLLLRSDGRLYGANQSGIGRGGVGALYSINKDGSEITIIKSFDDIMEGTPRSGLYDGPDGFLYGLIDYSNDLYRIAPDGSGYEILETFDNSLLHFSLMNHPQSSTGLMYAFTLQGFNGGMAKIYEIDTKSGTVELLYEMENRHEDGRSIGGGLRIDQDGNLFGIFRSVRANSEIFKFNPETRDITTVSTLATEEGFINATYIAFNQNGSLVGVGSIRGRAQTVLFELVPDSNTLTVFYEETINGPYYPNSKLLESSSGKLYGTTLLGGKGNGTIFGLNADGTGFSVLRNLDLSNDGGEPKGLIEGSDGYIYGINSSGGESLAGTIFKMSPDGAEFTVLHQFNPETDGSGPNGQLVEGPDGLLYGVCAEDGSEGFGSLFQISKSGDFSVIYDFYLARGGNKPNGSLTIGSDGRLYGFTTQGARNRKGAIYSIDLSGDDLRVLYETPFRDQGMFPVDRLVEGEPGVFYGVMVTGPDDFYSWIDFGLVFKLTVETLDFEILQTFVVEEDGVPYTGIAIDGQGNLYGGTDINFRPNDPETQAGAFFKLSAGNYDYEILRRLNETREGMGVRGITFTQGESIECPEIILTDLVVDPDKRAPVGKTVRPQTAMPSGEIASATWHWGNGETSPATIKDGIVSGAYKYETAGLFRISLEVKSSCGASFTAEADPYPVYDPEAGAIAGAGWFNSPQGAYIPKPSSSGKAFFSLSARYHRNSKTPSGTVGINTRDFKFNSSYLNWLIIEEDKAVLQGVGKLNGKGNYGFLMSTTESSQSGMIRIRIWDRNRGDRLVYDSDVDAAWDASPGLVVQGEVTILEGSGRKNRPNQEELFAELLKKIKAYPNPVVDRIFIDLGDLSPQDIQTLLTDAYGNLEIRDLHKILEGNILEFQLSQLKQGTYYIQIRTEYGYHSIKILKR